MEPGNDGFPIGISFSKVPPFSGSGFHVRFGGVYFMTTLPRRLIPLAGLHVRDVS